MVTVHLITTDEAKRVPHDCIYVRILEFTMQPEYNAMVQEIIPDISRTHSSVVRIGDMSKFGWRKIKCVLSLRMWKYPVWSRMVNNPEITLSLSKYFHAF